jgi:predicted DNA-binding transcriptional regulator
VIVVLVYGWILFFTEWTLLLIQVTLMIAVAGLGGILAWIGYTLATTPPPKPIEEIEKEIEKELEKLGTSVEEESTQGREEQKEGT